MMQLFGCAAGVEVETCCEHPSGPRERWWVPQGEKFILDF